MEEHLNIPFGSIGSKIICITNDLSKKEIFNNFDYIIKEIQIIDNEKIYKIDDDLYIDSNELYNNFKSNYAITLFKAQGEEYENFYFPDSSLKFVNGRTAYTLISRKKEKLTKETMNRNLP